MYLFSNKVFKNNYILGICWLAILIAYSYLFSIVSEDQKLYSLFIFLPILLGMSFQEWRFWTPSRNILMRITGLAFLVWCTWLSSELRDEDVFNPSRFLLVSEFTFVLFFSLLSIVLNDKKLIPKLSIEYIFIQVLLFIYFIWWIDYFFFTSIPIILWSIFLHISNFKSLKVLFSIISHFLSIIFWIYYITTTLLEFYSLIWNITNLDASYLVLQFFILGMSLIFTLYSLVIILSYIPLRIHSIFSRNKSLRVDPAKKLIDNFSNANIPIYYLWFIYMLLFTSIGLYSLYWTFSIEIFVWGMFILLSIFIDSIKSYLSSSKPI